MSLNRLIKQHGRANWRAGHFYIIAFALLVALTAIISVNLITAALAQTLRTQSATLLGGDIVLESATPIGEKYFSKASEQGLKTSRQVTVFTMASKGDALQLVQVNAVDDQYPLLGEVRIASGQHVARPSSGGVFAERALLGDLSIQLGDKLQIGDAQFGLQQVIEGLPDQAAFTLNISPQVLLPLSDLEKTKIIQPGSRVTYRLAAVGSVAEIHRYANWLDANKTASQTIKLADGRGGMLENLSDKVMGYLNFILLASVILAGGAIGVQCHHWIRSQREAIAVYRILGLTARAVMSLYAVSVAWLFLVCFILAWLLSLLIYFTLTYYFSAWLGAIGVSVYAGIIGYSFFMGLFLLYVFVVPPLLSLKNIKPKALLQQRFDEKSGGYLWWYVPAIFVLLGLSYWQLQQIRLMAVAVSGLIFFACFLLLFTELFLRLLAGLSKKIGFVYHHAIKQLLRQRHFSLVQIAAFSLCFTLFFAVYLIYTGILTNWRTNLPQGSPNIFLVNIEPQQVAGVKQFLKTESIAQHEFYPIVRGRITAINGKPVMTALNAEQRQQNALHRALNLTWASRLPIGNEITTGKSWQAFVGHPNDISFAESLAQALGLKTGDRVSFAVGNDVLTGRIVNLRKIDWLTLRPNFYAIFSPNSQIKNFPTTFMTSFFVPNEDALVVNRLIRRFPNITSFNLVLMLQQVQTLVGHMSLAFGYLCLFFLLAAIALLGAGVYVSRGIRLQTWRLFQVLGASRRQLYGLLFFEYAFLGLTAGLVAAITGNFFIYALLRLLLGLPYQWPWLASLLTVPIAVVLVLFLGLVFCRQQVTRR